MVCAPRPKRWLTSLNHVLIVEIVPRSRNNRESGSPQTPRPGVAADPASIRVAADPLARVAADPAIRAYETAISGEPLSSSEVDAE